MKDNPAQGEKTLSSFHPYALLDNATLATALAVSPRTLRRMVSRGEIPPGIIIGGRRRWFAGRVLEHLRARAEGEATKASRAKDPLSALPRGSVSRTRV